jgi:hypothetical protein
MIMVVFLNGQKIPTPQGQDRLQINTSTNEKISQLVNFFSRMYDIRHSGDAATLQDPLGQLLQVLACLIFGPVQ